MASPDTQNFDEFNITGSEAGPANREQENQRLLGLLGSPKNNFRITQDYEYEQDPRLNPESSEHQPFEQVLLDDWKDFETQRVEDESEKAAFEAEWLQTLSREEIENKLQKLVNEAKSEESKKYFRDYMERYLANVDDYENRTLSSSESATFKIPENSRLYQEFAHEFAENQNNVQDRFYSVEDYLKACLKEIEEGRENYPVGCNSAQELLQPFWDTEAVETASGRKVSVGSMFALEHAESFYENPESKMLHHVATRHAGRKRVGFADTEAVTLNQLHSKFETFLTSLAAKLEAGEISLPEGANNIDEAFRPLTEEELENWFVLQGLENSEFKKRFFGELNKNKTLVTPQPDLEGAVGEPEDFSSHQERWANRAAMVANRTYTPPVNPSVEVPPGLASDFYKRGESSSGALEISGELGAKIRDVKFDWQLERGFVKVDFVTQIEDRSRKIMMDRKVNVVFNLPKESIYAAQNGDLQSIQDTVLECVQKNQGSPFAQVNYDSSSGNIFFGLGEKDQPRVGVKLDRQGLQNVAGKRRDDVLAYMDRRAKDFRSLDFEKEAEPMWEFQNYLLQQYVPGYNKKLSQLVWDEAFAQIWKEKIGEEAHDKLKQKVEQASPEPASASAEPRSSGKPPEKTGVVIDASRAQRVMRKPEGQSFLNSINAEFGDNYLDFLTSGKFWDFKTNANLKVSEAMNILADKILLQAGRSAEYAEFQRFASLSKEEQKKIIDDSGIKHDSSVASALLGARLRMFLSSPDSANAGVGQRTRQADARTGVPDKVENAPRTRSAALQEIFDQSEKFVNSLPYNPDYDPEVEAGII
jgi:hypothetical protein